MCHQALFCVPREGLGTRLHKQHCLAKGKLVFSRRHHKGYSGIQTQDRASACASHYSCYSPMRELVFSCDHTGILGSYRPLSYIGTLTFGLILLKCNWMVISPNICCSKQVDVVLSFHYTYVQAVPRSSSISCIPHQARSRGGMFTDSCILRFRHL